MRLLWFLLAGLAGSGLLSARTPTPEPEEPEEVDIRFAVYVWPTAGILHENSRMESVPRTYVRTPGGPVQVPLARNSTTPLFRYRGPLPLELFDLEKIVTPPPEDAPPGTPPTITYRRHPRVAVSFPESWRQVMLIVFPGRFNEDGTLVTLPMRYGVDHIRPGFIRVHNSTDRNMLLEIGEGRRPLAGHGFVDIPAGEWSNESSLRLNVIGRDERGRARMLYTTTVNGREDESNLYVLYARDARRLRMLRVGGHKPPPTPTPESGDAPPESQN